MQSVTLPSGKTAQLRAIEDVTERQRRAIAKVRTKLATSHEFVEAAEKASAGKKLTKSDEATIEASLGDVLDIVNDLNDLLIVAAVSRWDYPFEVSFETIQDVSAKDLDRLREVAAPYLTELFPDFSPTMDKTSPTGV